MKPEDKQTTALRSDDQCAHIPPRGRLPQTVIDAMVANGAQNEEAEGEDLRILRLSGRECPSWGVYRDWACSLGEVDPLVAVAFAPSALVRRSPLTPPANMTFAIIAEARSIIYHMAPLRISDFQAPGIPALPGPLPGPPLFVNIHHAKVAVTALIEAISNPGANYPVINALPSGAYICDVQYRWSGGSYITVPVHKR